MPGHKRLMYGEMPKQAMRMDITEIDGFDNLHQSEDILKKLQEKAASLYGADQTFYLVGGSTCGILSAISAAVPEGGHILMARNCHKSAYHAAYLRNLRISYLYPRIIEEYDLNEAISLDEVQLALENIKDVDAVMIVSPTYEGRISDVASIANFLHERRIPLIIDEAHGAHLGWDKGFPPNSCQSAADVVIHSVHKTLPSMTQTALLHVNGDLISRERLKRFLHIYQSSSPSYVLMASIDNALTMVDRNRDTLFINFKSYYTQLLSCLSQCKYLNFLPLEEGKQDIGKLIISGKKINLSGQKIYDILLQEFHLQLEMAAGSYCLAMFTIADKEDAYQRFLKAMLVIDERIGSGIIISDLHHSKLPSMNGLYRQRKSDWISKDLKEIIPLRDAWDQSGEYCKLEDAIGKHVGEFVNLYPPGVPLLVPGEIITNEDYMEICKYIELRLNVQGLEYIDSRYYVKIIAPKERQ